MCARLRSLKPGAPIGAERREASRTGDVGDVLVVVIAERRLHQAFGRRE